MVKELVLPDYRVESSINHWFAAAATVILVNNKTEMYRFFSFFFSLGFDWLSDWIKLLVRIINYLSVVSYWKIRAITGWFLLLKREQPNLSICDMCSHFLLGGGKMSIYLASRLTLCKASFQTRVLGILSCVHIKRLEEAYSQKMNFKTISQVRPMYFALTDINV